MHYPPCPQNSIIVNLPSPSEFLSFLEVHFRLSNASTKKRTWIYASSRLWFSSARRQALLFSNKKNLLLWPGCANSFLTLNLAIKRNTTYGSVTPLCVLVLFWCFQSKIAQIQTVKIFWWANTVEPSIFRRYIRLCHVVCTKSVLNPYASCTGSVHKCLIILQAFLGSEGLVQVFLLFIGQE